MHEATRATTSDRTRHRCVRCGFSGAELQPKPDGLGGLVGSSALSCPSCGQDLYTRPPRSYAELEGFVEPVPARPPVARGREASVDASPSGRGFRSMKSAEAGLFLVLLGAVGVLVTLRIFDAIG